MVQALTRLMLAALAVLAAGGAAPAGELRLVFPDLRPGGRVSIAVFNSEEDWKSLADPVWSESVSLAGRELRLSRPLPEGQYAVMAYHDRNANGRLDTLPIGLPTEPYGFSNNARGMFGPAGWRAAVFRLGPGGAEQVIRLR